MKKVWFSQFLVAVLLIGCGGTNDPEELVKRNALLDPNTCKVCHPLHHQEWEGSLHAYAADDPVFAAFNRRGQRETNGELGDFCVQCHAPVAHRLGLTQDGLNLNELPPWTKGVNCYFCHQVSAITGTHNNPLVMAQDRVMRGGIKDPTPAIYRDGDTTLVHESVFSSLLDGSGVTSSATCGSCHDIVNPKGVHIERTFSEWSDSQYNPPSGANNAIGVSCASCHMPEDNEAVAISPGTKARLRAHHRHFMPGPDTPITPWPDPEKNSAAREANAREFDYLRKNAICATLCILPPEPGQELAPPVASMWLHNESAGHHWPSGSTADRRAWVELIGKNSQGQEVFRSGIVPEGVSATSIEAQDPSMWLLRDRWLNEHGQETHMFWEVASVERRVLPVNNPADELDSERTTWRERRYTVPGLQDRSQLGSIDVQVRFRAIGLDVLDDLIASQDLDPSFRNSIPATNVAAGTLNWPSGPAVIYSDTGYGLCVATTSSCRSPFVCSTRVYGCEEPPMAD